MGVYLYCVAPAGVTPPATLTGMAGAPVDAVEVAALACWVSVLDAPPHASVEAVRAHNGVVAAALCQATPLPVRFGQWLESREALTERIADRAAQYHAALERVAGAVEYGLRVVDPAARAPVPGPEARESGTSYLRALAERETRERAALARGRELADGIAALLGSLVRQQRVEPPGPGRGLLGMAHLVAVRDRDAYRAGVEEARRRWPSLRFLTSGPWPPYSFAGEQETDARGCG